MTKYYLPLNDMPASCMECPGLVNVSADWVPLYECRTKKIIFGSGDLIRLTESKPGWCPIITEEVKNVQAYRQGTWKPCSTCQQHVPERENKRPGKAVRKKSRLLKVLSDFLQ